MGLKVYSLDNHGDYSSVNGYAHYDGYSEADFALGDPNIFIEFELNSDWTFDDIHFIGRRFDVAQNKYVFETVTPSYEATVILENGHIQSELEYDSDWDSAGYDAIFVYPSVDTTGAYTLTITNTAMQGFEFKNLAQFRNFPDISNGNFLANNLDNYVKADTFVRAQVYSVPSDTSIETTTAPHPKYYNASNAVNLSTDDVRYLFTNINLNTIDSAYHFYEIVNECEIGIPSEPQGNMSVNFVYNDLYVYTVQMNLPVLETNWLTAYYFDNTDLDLLNYRPSEYETEGYYFTGWYAEDTYETYLDQLEVREDTILYGKLIDIEDSFVVTFDSNDGEDVSPQYVENGGTAYEPYAYRYGATFVCWCSDPELTTEFNFNTPIENDITLYAKWEIREGYILITFDTNGGSYVKAQLVSKDSEYIDEPSDPTKQGYAFEGWYIDAECTIPYVFEYEYVSYPMTLYAKWSEVLWTITVFEDNLITQEITVHDGATLSTITPTKQKSSDGRIFVYWVEPDNTLPFDFSQPIRNNLTLEAYYVVSGTDKWIMSLPDCYVGFKEDIAYLPVYKVKNGTKALALGQSSTDDESAYMFIEKTQTWVEIKNFTVTL